MIIFPQFNTNQLFFGRDFFGRRSLLWHLDPNNPSEFMLSSIATAYTVEIDSFSKSSGEDEDESSSSTSTGNNSNNNSTGFWTEVPAKGIYSLQLHLPLQEPVCHPWSIVPNSEREMYLSGSFSSFFNPPFSFLGSLNQQLPSEEEDIALKSVALALTSNASTGFTASKESLKTSTMAKLCNVLSESVRRRVQALPLISSSSSSSSSFSIKSSRIAILFSGGIDSMIIAALAHAHVPPNETIDLINVAFENKARTKATSNASDAIYNVPDRITGRAGWKELTQAVANNTILDTLQWATSLTNSSSVDESTPSSSSSSTQQPPESTASQFQRYRLVEVNVSRTEYDNAILHVASCMQPLETVMDLSIAAALWFAARGQGHIYNPAESSSSPVLYTSTSPVILVGMGADEQFAGYGRHRSKFEVAGWPGLLSEITLDTSRISSRNLGRDDRCISDHGKESRLPFLDEDVVAYLNSLPVHEKTNMYLPRGRGEKSLLRGLGYLFGLESASLLAKRAIQFGARTAKMDPGGGLRGQHKLLFVTQ